MRVLFINSVCSGSTGHIIDYLISTKHKNDDCVVAFGRGKAFTNHKCYKIGTFFSTIIHVFITRIFDAHGFGSFLATKKFISWIKKFNPDTIWLHNIHGYYLNIKLLFNYLKLSQKKVIWTIHDCWPITGHCAYFSFVNCRKWLITCKNCPQRSKYPKSYFSRSKRNLSKKKRFFWA